MNKPIDIVMLDSIRAEVMMALLNKKGREEIWKYDIIQRKQALLEALDRQNYDNIETAHKNPDKPYALVGPGIEDSYFGTVAELVSILFWLCQKSIGGELCVKPDDSYANQQEFLAERASYPFIPLAGKAA